MTEPATTASPEIIAPGEQQTALTIIDSMTPAEIYAGGAADPLIDAIEKEVSGRVFDVSIEADRKACASLAYKLAKTKTLLDGMGKQLTEEWRVKTAAVNKERTRIVDRLQALQDAVRAPLTAWEVADKARKEKIKARMELLKSAATFTGAVTTQQIVDRLAAIRAELTDDMGDLALEAESLKADAISALVTMRDLSAQADAEREELAAARKAAADALAKQEQERRDRAAAEAAQAAAALAQAAAIEAAERRAKELQEALEAEKAQRGKAEKAQAEYAEQLKRDAEAAEERARVWAVEEVARAKAQAEAAAAAALRADEERRQREAAAVIEAERKAAADEEHRAEVRKLAESALREKAGLDASAAEDVFDAIIMGVIPHVTVNF